MSKIRIHIRNVICASAQINGAKKEVISARTGIRGTANFIDVRIRSRDNLNHRLNQVCSRIDRIESQMGQIERVVSNGANQYRTVEDQAIWKARELDFGSVEKRDSGTMGKIRSLFEGNLVAAFDKVIVSNKGKMESGLEGTVSASLLSASYNVFAKSKYDLKEKNFYTDVGLKGEANIAQGRAEYSIGGLNGSIEGTVGSVSASGAVGFSLYKEGKLSPSLTAKAEAKAAAAEGKANVQFGNGKSNVHADARGSVLSAKAAASGGIGKIVYEDEQGVKNTAWGLEGKAGAEAYLAEGEISGGVNIFGIRVDLSVEGKAGGIGASAEGSVTTQGVKGKIGAGLGLGAGLAIKVDWSGLFK